MAAMISTTLFPPDSSLSSSPNCLKMIFFSRNANLRNSMSLNSKSKRRNPPKMVPLAYSSMIPWGYLTFLQYRILTAQLKIAYFTMTDIRTELLALIFSKQLLCTFLHISSKTVGNSKNKYRKIIVCPVKAILKYHSIQHIKTNFNSKLRLIQTRRLRRIWIGISIRMNWDRSIFSSYAKRKKISK